jgi:hypothetical protein
MLHPQMSETIIITYNAGLTNEASGKATSWTTLLSTSAIVVPLSGDASLLAAEMGYHGAVEFHCDYTAFNAAYSATAQNKMLRVSWGGRTYRVTGIVDAGNRHLVSILTAGELP